MRAHHRAHHHRQNTPSSRHLDVRRFAAGNDGKDVKKKNQGGGGEQGKADFSAYWSLRIKEFFASRKKTIEDMERKGMPEPDMVKKLNQKARERMEAMEVLLEEEAKLKQMKMEARRELGEQARKSERPIAGFVAMQPDEAAAVTNQDVELARASM